MSKFFIKIFFDNFNFLDKCSSFEKLSFIVFVEYYDFLCMTFGQKSCFLETIISEIPKGNYCRHYSKWCFLGGHHILKHWLKNVVWTGEPQPDNPNFKAELNFHTQGMKKLSIIGMVQGISFWNGFYELALTDKHIQVRFGLKMIKVCWDWEFWGTTTICQKSNIGWP